MTKSNNIKAGINEDKIKNILTQEYQSVRDEIQLYSNHFTAFDQDRWLIFLPIRHHSPSCALHVKQIIQQYKPDVVLIEGPSDCSHLLQDLVHPDTKPPVAIFDYFVDIKNILNLNGVTTPSLEVPYRYYTWYPFTKYSPEYQGVNTALDPEINAEVFFIDIFLDLKLEEINNQYSEKSPKLEKILMRELWSDFNFIRNTYIQKLQKRANCRDFNDLWFHLFEVNASTSLKNSIQFFSEIFAFGTITRKMTPPEVHKTDNTALRETFMAKQIQIKKKKFSKIIVITGAYHTQALMELVQQKLPKVKKVKESKRAFLTNYSYYRLSEISGYASGIPYPWFCAQIYDQMSKGVKKPYTNVILNILSTLAKISDNKQYKISTADIISAYHLAINLSNLRGRMDLSPFDLLDAVQSTFVKDEQLYMSTNILDELDKILIGSAVGSISTELTKMAIALDFEKQLKRHRLPKVDKEKNLRLDIYKRDIHRNKSKFLWQTRFLDLGYAFLKNGPNFIRNESLWLLTEQWTVRWSDDIVANLIQASMYGNTIEEACLTLFKEQIEIIVVQDSKVLAQYLLKAIQIGLFVLFDYILQKIQSLLPIATFDELIHYIQSLTVLYGFREAMLPPKYHKLEPYIKNTYNALIIRITDLSLLKEELLEPIANDFRTLSQIINDPNIDFLDADLLLDKVEQLSQESGLNPKLYGILLGFLYSFGRCKAKRIEQTFKHYVEGTLERSTPIIFLEGLISMSKKILLGGNLLNLIINSIATIPDRTFLELLPGLRRIFTTYVPRETFKISEMISNQLGEEIKPASIFRLPDEIILAVSNLDSEINDVLIDWGL